MMIVVFKVLEFDFICKFHPHVSDKTPRNKIGGMPHCIFSEHRSPPTFPHLCCSRSDPQKPDLDRSTGILAAFLTSSLAPSDPFSIQYVRWAFLNCKSNHSTAHSIKSSPWLWCRPLYLIWPVPPSPTPLTPPCMPLISVLQLHRQPLSNYPKGILSSGP